MNYQDLFQCLKGVGPLDLSGLILPLERSGYALHPIDCRKEHINASIVAMLTDARNTHRNSFLTYFTATPERTTRWLTGPVASDPTRILFSLQETRSNKLYGYMGLGYGDPGGSRIEGDAIVRHATHTEPGLMRLAFLRLVEWVRCSIGIREIWIRVLSDNPAVGFYQRCNFVKASEVPLYELHNTAGEVLALTESGQADGLRASIRTLTHMRYSPAGSQPIRAGKNDLQ